MIVVSGYPCLLLSNTLPHKFWQAWFLYSNLKLLKSARPPDLDLIVLFMLDPGNYLQAVILSMNRVRLIYFPSVMDSSSALPVVQCLKTVVLHILPIL